MSTFLHYITSCYLKSMTSKKIYTQRGSSTHLFRYIREDFDSDSGWFPIPQAGLKLTVQHKKTRLSSQVMRLQYTLGHKDQNASPQSRGFLFVHFFLRQEYWTVVQAGLELCKISSPSIQKPKSTGINNYTLKSNYI